MIICQAYGQNILEGLQNMDLEKKLKSIGVVISNKVSQDTFVVITKNDISGPPSSKIIDANELNINIVTIDHFTNKYNLL